MFALSVRSNFSFLKGASHPEELVERAAKLGYAGIGLADENTLAGVVRGFAMAREIIKQQKTFRYLVGCRLVFSDGTPDLIVYPRDRAAYGMLCRMLSEGKTTAGEKGACVLKFSDFLFRARGFQIIVTIGQNTEAVLQQLQTFAKGQIWLALPMDYSGKDARRAEKLADIAKACDIGLIAAGDILYHSKKRKVLQDVLTCIRLHKTIETAGFALEANGEKYLKPIQEIKRLYHHYPDALLAHKAFTDPITFSLDDLSYSYPKEPVPEGKTPQSYLEELSWAGMVERFSPSAYDTIKPLLQKELALIKKLDYAPYFLTVYDIVRFAKEQKILCQGRGSAANSAVCYCLGITNVNPEKIELLFERFISEERKEPPDIDVDFEHERREEVMQYIYRRYGRQRAAIVATVIRYRSRSAIRDVGKALGLSEDITGAIAGTVWGTSGKGISDEQIRQAGLDPKNPMIGLTVHLAQEILGFPRHLSQHVGGFVLTQSRLDETVPIGPAAMQGRSFIEWDKDDIDSVKLMKVDVLSLGMLTCIRKAFDLLKKHKAINYGLHDVPTDDKKVYEMLSNGDSLGVFQVESRAQMNMLPRLKPKEFYDLVIEVAIVRPGPIQGDMVHPYLRRRNHEEETIYPSPSPEYGPPDELKRVLGKTLGVPLFQEQAMRIAIEAAKFTPDEANLLRRAMATFRRVGTIHTMRTKMIEGMVKRGYERHFAENCFKQIEGFGEYGFPESHAASFAHLVYVSAWLKCLHPEVFATALLNSQPMGFYAPAQIVQDVRNHGVTVLPADVNMSGYDHCLEKANQHLALRLGFRQINGFSKDWSEKIVETRMDGSFASIEDLHRRVALPQRAFQLLADADCFRSLNIERRTALWAVRRLPNTETLPLFAAAQQTELAEEEQLVLPSMKASEHVIHDYETTRLSLKAHPMSFLRKTLKTRGVLTCRDAMDVAGGATVTIAGIITVRQKPGSAKGVVFLTMEDESGIANIVVWPKIMERFRREVMGGKLLSITGKVQRDTSGVTHLVANSIEDKSYDLIALSDIPEQFSKLENEPVARHPRQFRALPKSRDFH